MSIPLPQPPPDVPDPKDIPSSPSKWKWIIPTILVVAALLGIAGLSKSQAKNSARVRERTEAINNSRQIFACLMQFEADYGKFPDASTATPVKDKTKTTLTLDSGTSNALFRQIIVSGVPSEKPFWAKTAISPMRPDDYFGSDATALASGECGFAYIAGLSSKVDPGTPLVMTSLLLGQLKFDRDTFQGDAILLRADGSVTALPIAADGRVLIGGLDIFDPKQPFWGGKAPEVKWPE